MKKYRLQAPHNCKLCERNVKIGGSGSFVMRLYCSAHARCGRSGKGQFSSQTELAWAKSMPWEQAGQARSVHESRKK